MKVLHVGGDEVLILLLPAGTERTAKKQGIDLLLETREFILSRIHASVVASEMERQFKTHQ